MKKRFRRKLRLALLTVVMLATPTFFAVNSASAGGLPYTNRWAPNYYAPYANISHWSRPNTKFRMVCWFDFKTNRWFRGQIYDTGAYVYQKAFYISNQSRVPHC